MKDPRIAVVFVLSLAVWVLFKWKEPDPLSGTETLVVVFAIAALVYSVAWVFKKLRSGSKENRT